MSVFQTDNEGDLIFPLRLETRPGYLLAYRLRSGLALWQGTWFLDLDAGFPWREIFSGEKVSSVLPARAVFRDFLLSTPGVASIERLTAQLVGRQLRVEFTCTAEDGSTVSGPSPLSVNGVPVFETRTNQSVSGGGSGILHVSGV